MPAAISAGFPATTSAPSAAANGDAARKPASTGYGSGKVFGSARSASAGRCMVVIGENLREGGNGVRTQAAAGAGTPTGLGNGSVAAQAALIGPSIAASS